MDSSFREQYGGNLTSASINNVIKKVLSQDTLRNQDVQISKLKANLDWATDQIDKLERENTKYCDQAKKSNHMLKLMRNEILILRSNIASHEEVGKKKERIEKQNESLLRAENRDLRAKVSTLSSSLDEKRLLLSKYSDAALVIDKYEQQIVEAKMTIKTVLKEKEEAQVHASNLEKELKDIELQKTQFEQTSRERLERLSELKEEMSISNQKSKTKLLRLRHEIDTLEKIFQSRSTKRTRDQKEIGQLQKKILDLESINIEYQRKTEELKKIIKDKERGMQEMMKAIAVNAKTVQMKTSPQPYFHDRYYKAKIQTQTVLNSLGNRKAETSSIDSEKITKIPCRSDITPVPTPTSQSFLESDLVPRSLENLKPTKPMFEIKSVNSVINNSLEEFPQKEIPENHLIEINDSITELRNIIENTKEKLS